MSDDLKKEVMVVCGTSRRIVNVNFGNYEETVDAIRRKFRFSEETQFELQAYFGEKGTNVDIVDDDDLKRFKNVEELFVQVAPSSGANEMSSMQHPPTPVNDPTPPPSCEQSRQPSKAKIVVYYGDDKKQIAMDTTSFEAVHGTIKQRFKLTKDFKLQVQAAGVEGITIGCDGDLEDNAEYLNKMWVVEITLKTESKVLVHYAYRKEQITADTTSIAAVRDAINQKFQLTRDFQLQVKDSDSRKIDVDSDKDLKTHAEFLDRMWVVEMEPKVLVHYAYRKEQITADTTSITAVRDAIKQTFQLTRDFQLQVEDSDGRKNVDSDKDLKTHAEFLDRMWVVEMEPTVTVSMGDKIEYLRLGVQNFESVRQAIKRCLNLENQDFKLQVEDSSGKRIDIKNEEDFSNNKDCLQNMWVSLVEPELPADNKALALVTVEKEIFSVTEPPKADSHLVKACVKTMQRTIDVPSLSSKLEQTTDSLQIAYYASIDNKAQNDYVTDLQFKMQELCLKCDETMLTMQTKAEDALKELLWGCGYMLEGFEDFGLKRIGNVGGIAGQIKDAVDEKEECCDDLLKGMDAITDEKEQEEIKEVQREYDMKEKERLSRKKRETEFAHLEQKRQVREHEEQARREKEAAEEAQRIQTMGMKGKHTTMGKDAEHLTDKLQQARAGKEDVESRVGSLRSKEESAESAERRHRESDSGFGFGLKKVFSLGFYQGSTKLAEQEKRIAEDTRRERRYEEERVRELRRKEMDANRELEATVAQLTDIENKLREIDKTAAVAKQEAYEKLMYRKDTTSTATDRKLAEVEHKHEEMDNAAAAAKANEIKKLKEMNKEALHAAKTGLKSLTSILKLISKFWKSNQTIFGTIGEMESIDQLLSLGDAAARKEFWTSDNFKREAINIIARFAAIKIMCADFRRRMAPVLEDLHCVISDNPTPDMARAQLPRLIQKFANRVKRDAEALKVDDEEQQVVDFVAKALAE